MNFIEYPNFVEAVLAIQTPIQFKQEHISFQKNRKTENSPARLLI